MSSIAGESLKADAPMAAAPFPPLDKVRAPLEKLLGYCRARDWAGYDPYDGLNSRLFQGLPVLPGHRWPRLIMIQALKRFPVNLRPLFLVGREQNPKGVALFLTVLTKLAGLGWASLEESKGLAARLMELRSPGQDRFCWGYNFDWQTRVYLVPKGTPNIICTTFAAQALLDLHAVTGETALLEAAVEAGWFLMEGLFCRREGEETCFSYTPLDHSRIHNANLLGAALLARLYGHVKEDQFRERCLSCVRYSLRRQKADGSWVYGEEGFQQWIDSFHTGYNLLALREVQKVFPEPSIEESIARGFRFYLDHFFREDGVVKYYHDNAYPIDTHAVAHALVTLSELAGRDPSCGRLAGKVMAWADGHMRSPEGWYYFQKKPWITVKIPYMRWSQAWMLLGLTSVAEVSAREGR